MSNHFFIEIALSADEYGIVKQAAEKDELLVAEFGRRALVQVANTVLAAETKIVEDPWSGCAPEDKH